MDATKSDGAMPHTPTLILIRFPGQKVLVYATKQIIYIW